MGVSRSGYYKSISAENTKTIWPDFHLISKVKQIHKQSRRKQGARRMSAQLGAEGYNIGRYKARNLMRKAGVSYTYKKKFKPTTDSNHNLPLAQNLLNRKFNVDQPNTTWCADISYLWTNEGWLYLALVIDLVFSPSRWMGYQQTDESIPGERGSGDGLFSTSTW